MRIALYADRPASYGGIETHMATLAKELVLLGHQVRLCFPRIVQTELFADAVQHGAVLEAADPERLRQLASRDRIDVLHAHSFRASLAAGEIMRRTGVPAVVTLHSPGQRLPGPGRAAALIAVSGEISDILARQGLAHARIENGVDLRRFHPDPAPKPRSKPRLRLVYLGRVSPAKVEGLRELHRAVAFRRDVELRYVSDWAPDGKARPATAVEDQLRRADAVLATGRGVREAMACGLAALVLGSYWDGPVTPENVDRLEWFNFSGRESRQRPTAERMAPAIRELAQNPRRLLELKAFGARLAKARWDAREMARRTLAVYQEACSAPPRAAAAGSRGLANT